MFTLCMEGSQTFPRMWTTWRPSPTSRWRITSTSFRQTMQWVKTETSWAAHSFSPDNATEEAEAGGGWDSSLYEVVTDGPGNSIGDKNDI